MRILLRRFRAPVQCISVRYNTGVEEDMIFWAIYGSEWRTHLVAVTCTRYSYQYIYNVWYSYQHIYNGRHLRCTTMIFLSAGRRWWHSDPPRDHFLICAFNAAISSIWLRFSFRLAFKVGNVHMCSYHIIGSINLGMNLRNILHYWFHKIIRIIARKCLKSNMFLDVKW